MFLNNFSVRVPEGIEIPGGYVKMEHGKQYRLVLRNAWIRRCDARVEVDGKHVGTWRIPANQSVTLERPAHDHGKFTFYKSGTPEADAVGEGEIDIANRGLVKVTFTPELQTVEFDYRIAKTSMSDGASWETYYTNNTSTVGSSATPKGLTRCSAQSLSAGITGLSGRSCQEFGNAAPIMYDLTRQTVIHLRLTHDNGGPRPLTAFSTPIPPAV